MGFMSNQSIRRTKDEQMMDVEFVGKAKKVAHNTIEYTRPDGTRVIRFHLTDVVEFLTDGSVKLNSGGFRTFTTKERLNSYVPKGWGIYSEKGVWYLSSRTYANPDRPRYVFADGITISPDGTVTGHNPDEESRAKNLSKKINKFCRKFAALPVVPSPSTGDCWYCMMETPEGRPLGEASQNTDHLISHMDEEYFVGSLILRAMRWAKCTDFVISRVFSNDARMSCRDHAVRALRRYLRAQLGLSR